MGLPGLGRRLNPGPHRKTYPGGVQAWQGEMELNHVIKTGSQDGLLLQQEDKRPPQNSGSLGPVGALSALGGR